MKHSRFSIIIERYVRTIHDFWIRFLIAILINLSYFGQNEDFFCSNAGHQNLKYISSIARIEQKVLSHASCRRSGNAAVT